MHNNNKTYVLSLSYHWSNVAKCHFYKNQPQGEPQILELSVTSLNMRCIINGKTEVEKKVVNANQSDSDSFVSGHGLYRYQ